MLTKSCAGEFGAKDRSRGENPSLQRRIDLHSVGQQGALAVVDGSAGESYIAAVDFSSLKEGDLGVWCDCPWFQKGNNCKHLWGMLRKLERMYQLPSSEVTRFELYEVDASTMEVGAPLARRASGAIATRVRQQTDTAENGSSRSAGSSTPSANGQSQPAQLRQRAVSDWKNVLETITQAKQLGANDQYSEIPARVFQDARWQKRHWFVLSLADPVNQQSFEVNILTSTRKTNGDWGKPVPCHIAPRHLDDATDQRERAVFSLLEPVGPSYAAGYYGSEQYAAFRIDPALLDESLEALQSTGRFAWKLSDSRYFEDAAAIRHVDTGAPWRLVLRIAPSETKKTQLLVSASLRRGEEEYGIASVMLASEIGCALVQRNGSAAKAVSPLEEATEGDAAPEASTEPSTETNGEEAESTVEAGVIKIDRDEAAIIRAWQEVGHVTVPRRSINTLIDQLATSHENQALIIDPAVDVNQATGKPVPQCLLQQAGRHSSEFEATLFARYEDEEIPFDSPRSWWWNRSEKQVLYRAPEAEARWLETIPASGFRVVELDGSTRLQIPRENFLEVVETLRTAGWEVLADGSSLRIPTDFNISVTSGVDWFDVYADVEFGDVTASLPQLLAALRSGSKTVLLDDGTQGMLPEAWLKRFAGLEASGEEVDDAIRFGRTQALLIDTMLAEQDNVQNDQPFTEFCTKLKAFGGIAPADAPATFTGELREYQREGLGWFQFLQEFRFGGCLADDMGLGKTIQVLAMLEQRRSGNLEEGQERKPSIAVVPKSLIFNWTDEARRFTPQLNVFNYTGSDRRERFAQAAADSQLPLDLILTTYGTLRNDAAILRDWEFDYAILDEAQAIKNPHSLAARASRLLRADHRLAMTGTPVENHLGDLWSLFEFLNPGMLGSTPKIEKLSDDEDQQRIQHVSQSLRPFILRRKKEQVLTELPEKIEQTVACEMNSAQRKLYNQLRDHYRLHLSKKVKELGLKRSKIHVLEALLRLRQAACDPRLVNPNSSVTGTKITNLMQQLEEIVSEGHKALVFSQFTTLLGLVRQEIDRRERPYEYLDGKTNKRDQHVKRFQEDKDCQLFLISLKAGGNGLNLTAADYVFILDPWWNPAVEAQAIDRAHRMGQTKSVMAYRMICSETVEEKIIELQQSKRELADAIISQDNSLISELTADDLTQLLS